MLTKKATTCLLIICQQNYFKFHICITFINFMPMFKYGLCSNMGCDLLWVVFKYGLWSIMGCVQIWVLSDEPLPRWLPKWQPPVCSAQCHVDTLTHKFFQISYMHYFLLSVFHPSPNMSIRWLLKWPPFVHLHLWTLTKSFVSPFLYHFIYALLLSIFCPRSNISSYKDGHQNGPQPIPLPLWALALLLLVTMIRICVLY